MTQSIQEDIREKVCKFLSLTEKDGNHRYLSWNHCYLFFKTFSEKIKKGKIKVSPEEMNLASLHLAFYLASWGMYRGSSFVLWKDYKIYYNVVEELMQPEFSDLWNPGYYDDLVKLEGMIDTCHGKIKKVFKLRSKIEKCFDTVTYIKEIQEKRAHPTDTLITKTLLGTMACVPAYDNYFKMGLKEKDIKPYSSFSKSSLVAVLNFCKKVHLNGIKIQIKTSEGKDTGYNYPLMKMVDIYFWEVGLEQQQNNK